MPLEGVVEKVAVEASFFEQAVRDGEAIGRDVRQPCTRFSSIGKSPRAAEKSMTVLRDIGRVADAGALTRSGAPQI